MNPSLPKDNGALHLAAMLPLVRKYLLIFDNWATLHPWQARAVPLFLWLLFLLPIRFANAHAPQVLIGLYGVQMLAVALLLWRWRKLFSELTFAFHWLVLPASLLVLVLWIYLGKFFRGAAPSSSVFAHLLEEAPLLGYATLGVKLLGMTLVVPLIEELFFRSAIPRTLFLNGLSPRQGSVPSLKTWSWLGVLAAVALFALNHQRVDWAAAAITGLIWNLLTFVCNQKKSLNLGPAIWSHALVNGTLWAYCLACHDFALL